MSIPRRLPDLLVGVPRPAPPKRGNRNGEPAEAADDPLHHDGQPLLAESEHASVAEAAAAKFRLDRNAAIIAQ